jgi:hypothetical protein
MSINKELKKLETADYQNRKGEYPSSNVPDSIKFYDEEDGASIELDFKNTSEQEAIDWFNSSKEVNIVNKFKANYNIELKTHQDGDYPDDWIKLTVKLIKKSTLTSKTPIQAVEKIKVDDTETMQFSYTYVLSNPTQIKEINLFDYKDALEEIAKTYLQDKLINIAIDKSSYTMILTVKLEIGDKRRLGRLISQNTDLKQYVRKISYNNSQDKSGQLFVLKKANKEVKNETAN